MSVSVVFSEFLRTKGVHVFGTLVVHLAEGDFGPCVLFGRDLIAWALGA